MARWVTLLWSFPLLLGHGIWAFTRSCHEMAENRRGTCNESLKEDVFEAFIEVDITFTQLTFSRNIIIFPITANYIGLYFLL